MRGRASCHSFLADLSSWQLFSLNEDRCRERSAGLDYAKTTYCNIGKAFSLTCQDDVCGLIFRRQGRVQFHVNLSSDQLDSTGTTAIRAEIF